MQNKLIGRTTRKQHKRSPGSQTKVKVKNFSKHTHTQPFDTNIPVMYNVVIGGGSRK